MADNIMVSGLARDAASEDVHTVMTNDDNVDYIVELDDNDLSKKVWNVFVPSDNDEEFVVEKVEEVPTPPKKTKTAKKTKNVTLEDNLEVEPTKAKPKEKKPKEEKLKEEKPKEEKAKEKNSKVEEKLKKEKVKAVDEQEPPVKMLIKVKNIEKEKVKRGPTEYSVFLSAALKEVALDKTLDKSERMKKVQEMWKAKKAQLAAA